MRQSADCRQNLTIQVAISNEKKRKQTRLLCFQDCDEGTTVASTWRWTDRSNASQSVSDCLEADASGVDFEEQVRNVPLAHFDCL